MMFDFPKNEYVFSENAKLEYKISALLGRSQNQQLAGFWCDGILQSENSKHYDIETVNSNKYIILKAYMGKTGQDHYKLTLRLGKKSLQLYASNLSIVDCLPEENIDDALDVNIPNKTIEINLQ